MKKGELSKQQFDALLRCFFTNDWTNADMESAKEALGNMQTGSMSWDELDDVMAAYDAAVAAAPQEEQ